MTITETIKSATQLQQIEVSSLCETAKKFGASGEIVKADFCDGAALIVMIEGVTGREIVVIGKRGSIK